MSEILEQKKLEYIENTEKFKQLIETTLRNRLNEYDYVEIDSTYWTTITLYADDFELETDLDWDIEQGYYVGSDHGNVTIILKKSSDTVAEFGISSENELEIRNNMLYGFKDR